MAKKNNADTIDRMLAEIMGGRSVNRLCQDEDWTPSKSTFYRWMADADKATWDKYARAIEARCHCLIDEIVDIADTEEDHRRARIRIEARVTYAEKCAPKKYGKNPDLEQEPGQAYAIAEAIKALRVEAGTATEQEVNP